MVRFPRLRTLCINHDNTFLRLRTSLIAPDVSCTLMVRANGNAHKNSICPVHNTGSTLVYTVFSNGRLVWKSSYVPKAIPPSSTIDYVDLGTEEYHFDDESCVARRIRFADTATSSELDDFTAFLMTPEGQGLLDETYNCVMMNNPSTVDLTLYCPEIPEMCYDPISKENTYDIEEYDPENPSYDI